MKFSLGRGDLIGALFCALFLCVCVCSPLTAVPSFDSGFCTSLESSALQLACLSRIECSVEHSICARSAPVVAQLTCEFNEVLTAESQAYILLSYAARTPLTGVQRDVGWPDQHASHALANFESRDERMRGRIRRSISTPPWLLRRV